MTRPSSTVDITGNVNLTWLGETGSGLRAALDAVWLVRIVGLRCGVVEEACDNDEEEEEREEWLPRDEVTCEGLVWT